MRRQSQRRGRVLTDLGENAAEIAVDRSLGLHQYSGGRHGDDGDDEEKGTRFGSEEARDGAAEGIVA